MTILAQLPHKGESLTVEVTDVFTTGDGRKLASVRALTGQPFTFFTHGGPMDSDSANVPACVLRDVRTDPQPEPAKPNLLTMALAYQERRQWASGESVPLVKGQSGRLLAWLKNNGGAVWLLAEGAPRGLLVFILARNGWQPVNDLESKYQSWAAAALANRSK